MDGIDFKVEMIQLPCMNGIGCKIEMDSVARYGRY